MALLRPSPQGSPTQSPSSATWTAVAAVLALGVAATASCAGSSASTSAEPAPTGAATAAPAGPFVIKSGAPAVEAQGTARGEGPTPPCDGNLPATAQFQMDLPENMLAMTVEVEGERLTLQVRAGQGKWCGKASGNKVAVGRGAWSKGTYDILVGTEEAGGNRPFKLTIREEPR